MANSRNRATFANLAEEVLRDADEALSVDEITQRVCELAPKKESTNGRKKSNYYLKSMLRGEATYALKTDKRFAKVKRGQWKVNLWTLVEE